MATEIKFRRGLAADLPTDHADGEPLWTTDTETLYVGDGDGGAPPRVLMAGTGVVVNADLSASAAIARSKIAAGTASHVVTNDGSGNLTSTASITVAQGGTGTNTLTANNVILGNGTSAVSFVAPSTSGNVLTSNGTTWQSTAPASSGPTIKVVGTAETTLSNTLAASTALTVSPTWANTTTYAVSGVLLFSNPNANPDVEFQFYGPAVTTLNISYQVQRHGSTSIIAQEMITSFVNGGTTGNLINLTAAVVHVVSFAGGFITTGTPGSNPFQVQFGQAASDGVNATSLLVGSHFMLARST